MGGTCLNEPKDAQRQKVMVQAGSTGPSLYRDHSQIRHHLCKNRKMVEHKLNESLSQSVPVKNCDDDSQ